MRSRATATAVTSVLLASIFILCAGIPVFAQAGRGSINGEVTDPSGAVIPGAKVTVKNPTTGVVQSTVTTAGGRYSFLSLSPGAYTVTVSQKGFTTVVQDNVLVTVDQATADNIVLALGNVNEVVTVEASASLVEASNTTVGQLIDSSAIDRVPLFSRDVYELVQLSAGVIPTNGSPNAADTPTIFNARSLLDVSGYTVNGALLGSTHYMVDGSTLSIIENGAGTIMPAIQIPEEAIEEYRVETQNIPVTYQSAAGGVISLATKSGSNKFHGGGFVVLRPDVLAANDYFLKKSQVSSGAKNEPASFHRYQEGGSIGGPILQGKLFFFADYEATQQESLETDTLTFPTAAELTGDFSGDSFTIYNPLVADAASGTRQAFQGNKIPIGDIDPVAAKIAAYFPAPNQAGIGPYHQSNYFYSGLDPNNAQKFDIRVDWNPSEKQHFFSRFSFGRLFFGSADAYRNNWDPNYYSNTTNERNILIADDYTLSQHSMLQLRYSFARHYENQVAPGQYGFDISTLGFPASLASEVQFPIPPYIGFSNFTSGLGGGGANGWFFPFASENSDASVTYTHTMGKQVVSAGLEYEKQFLNVGGPYLPSGGYFFDNTATSSTTFAGDGSDFAAFLLGMGSYPGNESENFTDSINTAESNPYYGGFIQDNYQLLQNLSITAGLRWDVFGSRTERHDRLEFFDPDVQYSVAGVALQGGEQFAAQGWSRKPFQTNLKNFAPRLSVAWQPTRQFVVHSGAGIYYGPSTHMSSSASSDSDGFNSMTAWNATAYNADGNSVIVNPLSNPFPGGVVEPTGPTLGAATGIGTVLNTVLHRARTSTIYNYNLGVEYQFPHDVVLGVAYVGSHGGFLPFNNVNLNQLPLSTIAQYGSALDTEVPNPWEAVFPSTSSFYQQATVPQWLTLEPFPQFSSGGINHGVGINGYPGGDSTYNSLQVKAEKRLTKHFSTLATLTWGKIMTDEANNAPLSFVGFHGGAAQDWRDRQLEHSLSPQDIHYQFTWHASYDLPVGPGRALNLNRAGNAALSNWTLNWVLYRSSGVPIATPNGTGDPYFNQRVDMTCDPGKHAPHTADQWFSYSCFAQPSSYFVAGKSPTFLSHVRTNGAHDLDMSLYKNVPLKKGTNLRFDVSAYNVTNSVQFGYPSVFWNPSPTEENMSGFGQVTSDVNTPRQWQVGSRFTF